MNIAAICPTHARPTLLANMVACYLSQDHPAEQRRLLIFDSNEQVRGSGDGWEIVSTANIYPTLTSKYRALVAYLDGWWPEWEAFAIMEDDDIYGPKWLSSHAKVMRDHLWSHPTECFSTYGRDILAGDAALRESAVGRFWASSAVRRDLSQRIGLIESPLMVADQHQMNLWASAAPPGDPCRFAAPQYCYGWGRANHLSARSGVGWYSDCPPMEIQKVDPLVPKTDKMTRLLYQNLWASISKWERRRRQSMCKVCLDDKEDRCRRACNGSDYFAVWTCPDQKWQPEAGILSHEDMLAWTQRDPAAGRAELPEITRRNLIYHCYPTQANESWRWQAERIAKTANQFNGHRIIAIAVDDTTHDLTEVYKTFGKAFEFTPLSNDTRLRETASFKNLLQTVASTDAHEATFYGHSKGNSTTGNPIGAEFWARASYHVLLNDSKRINGVLRYWSACGLNIINLLGNRIYPTGLQHGEWLFSGTFFWFRHDRIFTVPNWDVVPDDRYGTEAWVSGLLKLKDVWTEYQAWSVKTYPTPSPYNPYSYIDEILD
jgi:hypothetical protein